MKSEEKPKSAASKAGFIIFLIILAVATYFSVQLYKNMQNTPEHVTQTFVRQLEKGEVEQAYDRLATDLKSGREQYWKSFLDQCKSAEGEAVLVSQELVSDTFNTYPDNSEPQRFVYKFRLQGRDYILDIVIFKVQNVWTIAGLTGAYR